MKCPKCGAEMENDGGVCSRCAAETAEVKVLPPDERDDFKGMTIQQGGEAGDKTGFREEPPGSYEYRSEGPGHRVYVRQVSFGSQSMGLLTKLLIVGRVCFFNNCTASSACRSRLFLSSGKVPASGNILET